MLSQPLLTAITLAAEEAKEEHRASTRQPQERPPTPAQPEEARRQCTPPTPQKQAPASPRPKEAHGHGHGHGASPPHQEQPPTSPQPEAAHGHGDGHGDSHGHGHAHAHAHANAAGEQDVEAALARQVSKRDHWKSLHFHAEHNHCSEHGNISLVRNTVRCPDEDFFIDVLSLFEHLVPGWADASIDSQGLLDFHGGSASRSVPFLAILLVVPAYLLLPVVGLRSLCRCGQDIQLVDRLACLLRLSTMGWLAWSLVLYFALGTPREDISSQKVSVLALCFPLWALAWFGYNIANKNLLDACDSAVEEMKEEVNRQTSSEGETFVRDALMSLSSPADTGSLYPMFVSSEGEEPHSAPLGVVHMVPITMLVAIQVLYALWPVLNGRWNAWSLVISITSAAAIGYAAFTFCYDLGQKMEDFKDCLDEVRVFLFLASPPELRLSRRRREEYLRLLLENARTRAKLTHTSNHQKIEGPSKEFRLDLRRRVSKNQDGVLAPRVQLPLDIRRVELDLSTIQGVALFQHLQGWVCADIVNERFGIDTSASLLVVMLLLMMGVVLAPLVFHSEHHVSLTQTVAMVDIFAMLIYIGLTCNFCVLMNELLFEHSDRVLLMWKDHARVPKKVIGRAMVNGEKKDFVPSMDASNAEERVLSQPIHKGPMEVRAMIDITRERLSLQEPQQLLGMKVTPALRAKLLSTLAGGLAAAAISLLKKHLGEN